MRRADGKFFEIVVWPAAFVFVAIVGLFMLRRSLVSLLDRARGFSYGDKAVDLSGQASAAVQEQRSKEAGPGLSKETVAATQAMPPASEVHAAIEAQIGTSLPSDLPRDLERAWLIRGIAVARIQRAHEIAYRIILGSQLALLLLANSSEPATEERARQIYEAAKAANPAMYQDFPFERWSHWPVWAGLLRTEQADQRTLFRITPIGRDFLHYLVDMGLTTAKVG